MKTIRVTFLIIFGIFSFLCFSQGKVKFVAKVIPEKSYISHCFKTEKSKLPQITGLNDKKIEEELNRKFLKNWENVIKYGLENFGDCPEMLDLTYKYPSTLNAKYEVLTLTPNFISVLQKFTLTENKGGNRWEPISIVINYDLKRKTFLQNTDIISNESGKIIHDCAVNYFQDLLHTKNEFSDIEIANHWDKINLLKIGIKDKNLFLYMDYQPEAHSTLKTYEIPLVSVLVFRNEFEKKIKEKK